jgi:hypothetical protein
MLADCVREIRAFVAQLTASVGLHQNESIDIEMCTVIRSRFSWWMCGFVEVEVESGERGTCGAAGFI